MNKFVASVLGGLVVAGGIAGGYFYANSETNEPKQEAEVKQASATQEEKVSVAQEEKEVANVPERTVDMRGSRPWEFFGSKDILAKVDEEQFYLWEDAEPFENVILEEISNPDAKEPIPRYIEGFIRDLQPYYPDKQEYFDKMQEVADAFGKGEFDKVRQLIQEAKQLREAE
ncbi:hypothetical protein ETC03_12075 [Geobacillus sp. MMMUD3]|nr:hypothetical protein [Geobacillus sp. MMMUD3]